MGDPKWTPGPWSVWEGGVVVHDHNIEGNVICLEPEHMMKASLASWPDNANLIAAAPSLYDALSGALSALNENLISSAAVPREPIIAALAKAEGRS